MERKKGGLVREEFKARRYRVSWHYNNAGDWAATINVVWAYSAADAQYQVELLIKRCIPKDSDSLVLKIEPVDCMELEESSSAS